jgi:two-component system response regulator VicR
MKILICEDDSLMLHAIDYKLKSEGYETYRAADGKEAKEIIKQKNDIELVITDLLMPFVGGLEVIDYLKNDLKWDVPVIVLSRVGLEETVLKAFELGADDYIVKPFSPAELSIRVKMSIAKKSNA